MKYSWGKINWKFCLLRAIHVGHIVFYNRKQGFVIGGDVLFRMGIGRTDIPGGDSETLLIKHLRKTFYPA